MAILNRKLYIIDEASGNDYDRLLSMEDINGTGWVSYGQYGFGQDQFRFYEEAGE